jgi:hypothetical protein
VNDSLCATHGTRDREADYDCAKVPSGAWCLYNVRRTWDFHQVTTGEAGTWWVCEKLIIADTHEDYSSALCATTTVSRNYSTSTITKPLGKNSAKNKGEPQNIHGYGYW